MKTDISRLSNLYLICLLYSYKIGFEEACNICLIPKGLFQDVYNRFETDLKNLDFRLNLIKELLRRGESPEKIAEAMDWRDFEYLVGRYFGENGFTVRYNYRFRRPRREIDVIAYREDILFCIDCKNWDKALSPSIIRKVVGRQVERAGYLCNAREFRGYRIFPLIVVMRHGRTIFYKGVGVIPISGLKEFIQYIGTLVLEGVITSLSC